MLASGRHAAGLSLVEGLHTLQEQPAWSLLASGKWKGAGTCCP